MIRVSKNREIWLPVVEQFTEFKLSGGAPVAEKLLPRLRERKQVRHANHKQIEKPNDLRPRKLAPQQTRNKKEPPCPAAQGDNREASNRVDRSHSMSRRWT